MPTPPYLFELTERECLEILHNATIARVGLSVGALPVIFPVFITMVDDLVVFPTHVGTSLASGAIGSILALQTDTFDPVEQAGSSVLARGYAELLADPDRARVARDRLHPIWASDARSQLVQVAPSLLTGRHFGSGIST